MICLFKDGPVAGLQVESDNPPSFMNGSISFFGVTMSFKYQRTSTIIFDASPTAKAVVYTLQEEE